MGGPSPPVGRGEPQPGRGPRANEEASQSSGDARAPEWCRDIGSDRNGPATRTTSYVHWLYRCSTSRGRDAIGNLTGLDALGDIDEIDERSAKLLPDGR